MSRVRTPSFGPVRYPSPPDMGVKVVLPEAKTPSTRPAVTTPDVSSGWQHDSTGWPSSTTHDPVAADNGAFTDRSSFRQQQHAVAFPDELGAITKYVQNPTMTKQTTKELPRETIPDDEEQPRISPSEQPMISPPETGVAFPFMQPMLTSPLKDDQEASTFVPPAFHSAQTCDEKRPDNDANIGHLNAYVSPTNLVSQIGVHQPPQSCEVNEPKPQPDDYRKYPDEKPAPISKESSPGECTCSADSFSLKAGLIGSRKCGLINFTWMGELSSELNYPYYHETDLASFQPGTWQIYNATLIKDGRPYREIFGNLELSPLESRMTAEVTKCLLSLPDFPNTLFTSTASTQQNASLDPWPRYTLRFLQYNDFKIDLTVQHIIDVSQWLNTWGPMALNSSIVSAVLIAGIVYFNGYDKEFRPTLVFRVERWHKYFLLRMDDMASGDFQVLIELAVAHQMLFFRRYLTVLNKVEQLNLLLDFGEPSDDIPWVCENVVSLLNFMSRTFPDYIHQVFVVPSASSANRQMIKELEIQADEAFAIGLQDDSGSGVFHGQLLKRIHYLGNADCAVVLEDHINPAQLEKDYGGQLPNFIARQLPLTKYVPMKKSYRLGNAVLKGNFLIDHPLIPHVLHIKYALEILMQGSQLTNQLAMTVAELESRFCEVVCTFIHPMQIARWLLATNFSFDEVTKRLDSFIRNPVRLWVQPLFKAPYDGLYWHGRDRKKRPILVIRLKRLSMADSPAALSLLRWQLEFAIKFLLVELFVYQWVVLVDLVGCHPGMVPFCSPVISLLEEHSERLHSLFLVRCPMIVKFCITLLQLQIPSRTRAKISVLAGDIESKIISSRQLEISLGGKAKNVAEDDELLSRAMPIAVFPDKR